VAFKELRGSSSSSTPETPPLTSAQLAAALRAEINRFAELVPVAEAGAEFFRVTFSATTVTVTTYHRGRFRDLVNVGYLPPGEERYPQDCLYPETLYPESLRALQLDGGYFTSDLADPRLLEYSSTMAADATSVMGMAMVAGGEPRGEICLTRTGQQPPFDRQEFELARDLARLLGNRLMMALRRRR